MWPASKVVPKELFPLGRMPAIVHLVSELVHAGIDKIILVVAEKNIPLMTAMFDPAIRPPAKVASDQEVRQFEDLLGKAEFTVECQSEGYGNAMPLIVSKHKVGDEPCVYAFGDDVVFGENMSARLIETYDSLGCPVLAAQEVESARRSSYGIVETVLDDGFQYVTRLVEKPTAGQTDSRLASFGRYLITPELMKLVCSTPPGKGGEIWFVDAVIRMVAEGRPVAVVPLTTGTWYTVGDPASFAAATLAALSLSPALPVSSAG